MKRECNNCQDTGWCATCNGTGRFGYPGFGNPDNYQAKCTACSESGVCRNCRGKGEL